MREGITLIHLHLMDGKIYKGYCMLYHPTTLWKIIQFFIDTFLGNLQVIVMRIGKENNLAECIIHFIRGVVYGYNWCCSYAFARGIFIDEPLTKRIPNKENMCCSKCIYEYKVNLIFRSFTSIKENPDLGNIGEIGTISGGKDYEEHKGTIY